MMHTRNVAKSQNYNSRKFGLKMKIRSTMFFPQNNCIYSHYVLFKIRRMGFRRIGKTPPYDQSDSLILNTL